MDAGARASLRGWREGQVASGAPRRAPAARLPRGRPGGPEGSLRMRGPEGAPSRAKGTPAAGAAGPPPASAAWDSSADTTSRRASAVPSAPAPGGAARTWPAESTGSLKPRPREPRGRGSEDGTLTSRRADRLGIRRFECPSQPRICASVFRYLLSLLPVPKSPLRAVPLAKTGHPLRPPPNK